MEREHISFPRSTSAAQLFIKYSFFLILRELPYRVHYSYLVLCRDVSMDEKIVRLPKCSMEIGFQSVAYTIRECGADESH
jgi:hypothetical protein